MIFMNGQKTQKIAGFTLVELVLVIVLMSSVGTLVAQLMTQPFARYEATSRRAELASLANAAMNRMVIDLQNSVPNSVRVGNPSGTVTALELLLAVDGGRYRSSSEDSDQSETNALAPAYDDDQFNVLGTLSLTSIPIGYRIIVNPFDQTALYTAAAETPKSTIGIITPASNFTLSLNTSPSDSDPGTDPEYKISFGGTQGPLFQFDVVGNGSPRNRFYISSTPVTYRCSEVTGELTRFTSYAVSSGFSGSEPSGADSALVLNSLSSCVFRYNEANYQQLGVVTLSLEVTRGGETVSLVKQVQVFNSP